VDDTQPVTYEHDGVALAGFARLPTGDGPHPAVLIIHGGLGIRHIVPETAQRLAESGYLAVAADMVGPAAQIAGGQEVMQAAAVFAGDPALLRSRTAAWVDAVAALPAVAPGRIAVIGYCFGGHCALELARSGADVRAVVSFHGILTTPAPAEPGAVRAHVAVYSGGKDPYAPAEHVEDLHWELRNAGAAYQITTFAEAEHAFTDPHAAALGMPGLGYNAIADEVSWAGMMALLQRTLRDGLAHHRMQ
jgi:dienelactone hydrolase